MSATYRIVRFVTKKFTGIINYIKKLTNQI